MIEINHVTNDDWGGEQRVHTKTSSTLLVDRYDARALLDEFSLHQLSTGIKDADNATGVESVSVNCHSSSSFEEDGSREEVKARNFARYEGLENYLPTKSNTTKVGGENMTRRDSGSDNNHINQPREEIILPEKEKLFRMSEEQSKGFPSGIQLVSIGISSV